MKEIFKDIEGYYGLYQISNLGRVKSLKFGKERILKPSKNKDEYLKVVFSKQGKRKYHYIHRLVAQAFIENQNNLPEVNHKDKNPANNTVENLEFCDRQYNIDYSNSKRVLCVETSIVYPSTMEVQRQLGFANTHISNACRGKYKQAYGYTWQYVS